jgi:phosphate transport system substrate-binding protein
MPSIFRSLLFALPVLSAAMPGPAHAQDAQLRMHGSNTIGQRLAPALVREWMASRGLQEASSASQVAEELRAVFADGSRRVTVDVHSHGTGTGFADLLEGRADLWMASRPVNAGELAQSRRIGELDAPAQEHVIALDGLAIIVHPGNRLRGLSLEQVRAVFAGRVLDWAAFGGRPGLINLYARDDKSGTFDSFRSMVLRDLPLAPRAARFESTDQLAASVAEDPNGIGFVGLAGVGQARPLAISDSGTRALLPGRITVGTEDYVLSRRLFLYSTRQPTPLASEFIEFVLGPRGQQVVERIGFVSQDVVAIDVPPRTDVSAEYVALTEGARRLSLNFRFGAHAAELDNKALRDIGRLVDFVRQPGNAALDLILVGFTDGHEIEPYQALSLSNDRVDLVALQLGRQGVGARRVRGMGYAAPVASDDSDLGRARNRRVEVWVRQRPGAEIGPMASAPR